MGQNATGLTFYNRVYDEILLFKVKNTLLLKALKLSPELV